MKTKLFPKILSYILPRSQDVVFIIVFFVVLANGSVMLNSDGDLPRHLLMGKYVLEGNSPPTDEIFSYPYTGRGYVPHEWGAGVIFYLAYLAFDLRGVVWVAAILVAATFLLIYVEGVRSNHEPLLTFLLVLPGVVVTSVHWITRPHLFTMLFLAIWLSLADRHYRGAQKKPWVFAIWMLLWANVHAEYITGFLVLGTYLADSLWTFWRTRTTDSLSTTKAFLAIFLLSFISSLINPSGLKAWTTVAGYINNSYLMSTIGETQPPNFMNPLFAPLLILYLFSIVLIVTQRQKYTLADFLLIAGFGSMSMLSARNSHLFGVVAPLVLARGLQGIRIPQAVKNVGQMFSRLGSTMRGNIIPGMSAILLGVILLAGPLKADTRFDPKRFPVEAVQWLENHPQSGHMFNAFNWGGYILFHLWPSQQVFIESQVDTQGDLTKSYIAVKDLHPGWDTIFTDYNITWAIIPPDWSLVIELKQKDWIVLYQDATAIILRQP